MSIPRHTARAIVIHADSLLLMERWRPGHHYFSIPGGGIEPGETPEQAVLREIEEETSCRIAITRALYVLQYTGNLHHIFLCEYISGEPHLPADSPEASQGPDNRFKPLWLPLTELADAPFIIWQPVKERLLHDLEHGFAEEVTEIVADKPS
jgi:ADP-ribose pyrophosphatase YjhB (NUDIX family)